MINEYGERKDFDENMKKIFIVEDDCEISKNLTRLLLAEQYQVVHAATVKEACQKMTEETFDLALVDILLPDGNGFAVCTELKQTQNLPVIFLTASGDEASVVTGLKMGADDYIIKPFRPRELLARIENALRKYGSTPKEFCRKDVVVNLSNGTVKKAGQEIYLSALEYRLLLIFISHPDQILTRNQLLNELWDASGEFVTDNTLTVYIKRLREKIETDASRPELILTVRGIGYRLGGKDAAK